MRTSRDLSIDFCRADHGGLSVRRRLTSPPVKVELVGQHPPVVASSLRRVQAAAQLLSDGNGDPKGVWPDQRGDVTGRVEQGRVDALRLLQRQHKKENKKNVLKWVLV